MARASRYRGLEIERTGDGFARVTAPTYAWLRIDHFVDAADRSGPAIDADTNPGRRLQTILLHHSEITEVRKLTRHLPQDRRFRR